MTDAGIKGLCVSVDAAGLENDRIGRCKSIHTLRINGTEVSLEGIQTALENLPALKDLQFGFFVPDMNYFDGRWPLEARREAMLLHPEPPFIDQRFRLPLLAPMLSRVNKVKFVAHPDFDAPTDDEFLELLQLERINELTIGDDGERYDDPRVTFHSGLMPIMKKFGHFLTSLSLVSLKNLDIRAIVDYCPNLEILYFDTDDEVENDANERLEEDQRPSKRMKNNPILEKLKILKIQICHISVEILDLLLSSPGLIDLNINADTVIDDSFQKAFNLHQFRRLKRLELFGCKSLTKDGIKMLLNENNSLKFLNIVNCSVKERTVTKWRNTALEKNWDLKIYYR